MSPMMMIPVLAFLGVAALVGVLAFVLRDGGPKTSNRLDVLVGKRSRDDEQATDILRKSAFEGDKKSFFELLTPKFLSPQKLFEQADCHIKPGTLFGIGIGLGLLGATGSLLARVPMALVPLNALVLFSLPF